MSFCLSVIIENIKFFAENVLRTFGNIFNLNIVISSIITLLMLFFIYKKNRKIIISYGKKINILNIIKSIFRFIHKYYIMSFIILFILSAVAFLLIYFGHSKKIENRFDKTLQNYEKSMSDIFNNIITNGINENIYTNSFQTNNNQLQNDSVEKLKLSFEVGFKMLESSMSEIMKNSNDILQFWFAFLSVIMIVFTLIGFFLNNNILDSAKKQLEMVEKEAIISRENIEKETKKLIKENNKKIQEINLFNLGLQAHDNKDYKASIDYFTKVINLNIKNSVAYYNIGLAKYYLKDYEGAIENYNEAIRLNPNYPEAYNNRGIAKYELKLFEETTEDFNKAIELNPNYSMAYNNRGIAKFDLAKNKEKNSEEYNQLIEKAMHDYNKAIELNINNSKAYYNRGEAKSILASSIKEVNKEEYNKLINKAYNDFETAYNLANNEFKKEMEKELINLAKQGYKEAIKFCEENDIDYKN